MLIATLFAVRLGQLNLFRSEYPPKLLEVRLFRCLAVPVSSSKAKMLTDRGYHPKPSYTLIVREIPMTAKESAKKQRRLTFHVVTVN